MRVFVTGASGWIGSAVVPELLAAGHQVLGLARSDASAAKVAGARRRGPARRPRRPRRPARRRRGRRRRRPPRLQPRLLADGRGGRRPTGARSRRSATRWPGTGGAARHRLRHARLAPAGSAPRTTGPTRPAIRRVANAAATLALADRGVRSLVVRFAPTVHGARRPRLRRRARRASRGDKGVSAYVGDGANRWPAVHRLDAARARPPRGRVGAGRARCCTPSPSEGVPTREIAEAIGRGSTCRSQSIPAADAAEHFGWIGGFFGMDMLASSDLTRELLGWTPTHPGLLEDLEAGSYDTAVNA